MRFSIDTFQSSVEPVTKGFERGWLACVLAVKVCVRAVKLLGYESLGLFGRGPYPQLVKEVESLLARCPSLPSHASPVSDFKTVFRFTILRKKNGLQLLQKYLWQANGLSEIKLALPNRPHREGRQKILYVTGMFPSIRHAGGLRLFDIIEELSKAHDVDLFSAFELADEDSLTLLRSRLSNVRLVGTMDFGWSRLLQWFLEREIDFSHYDVIQFEYPNSAELIAPARVWTRRSGFTLMENITKRDFMSYEQAVSSRSPLRRRAKTLLGLIESAGAETLGMKAADFSIAVTADDSDFAYKISGLRADVVRSGISNFTVYNRLATEMVEAEPNTLMFLGYYDHTPNVDAVQWYLRSVHPIIRERVPNVVFEVVGAGDLTQLKAEFGHLADVRFIGAVESVIPSISKARVCLSPLVSGAGFRGKINQYAAVKRPTVTTSIGVSGQPYIHGESVFVADAPEEFAKYVVELLTNEEKWRSMANAAEEQSLKTFSWPAIIKELEQIYAR